MNKINKNKNPNPFISIVILNWNGYKDTIECLQSFLVCDYDNFEIILVDNASTDGSVEHIKKWIAGTSFKNIRIIENLDNYGFAKGNNIGIAVALENKAEYVLLLNNDTVVDKHFLENIVRFFNDNKSYFVATPQIRYFDKPEIIWNCGGKLSDFGTRKYFYEDRSYKELPQNKFFDVSFITGCALIVRSEVYEKIGMLTEDFFFGEEDFEFSLRLKKNKISAACILDSVVYHKVNSSISKTSDIVIGKIFINYLSRFVNLKNYMSLWKWQLWRYLYIIYIIYLLRTRHKIQLNPLKNFILCLLRYSSTLKGTDKATFDKCINFDFSYKLEL